MKYFIVAVAFGLSALSVQAQTNNPTIYTYKQKLLNDTLQMLFPDLQPNTAIEPQHNMPMLQLNNDGVKVGSSNLGDLYSMNTDKMPCIKPLATKDDMPNAIKRRIPISPAMPKEKK